MAEFWPGKAQRHAAPGGSGDQGGCGCSSQEGWAGICPWLQRVQVPQTATKRRPSWVGLCKLPTLLHHRGFSSPGCLSTVLGRGLILPGFGWSGRRKKGSKDTAHLALCRGVSTVPSLAHDPHPAVPGSVCASWLGTPALGSQGTTITVAQQEWGTQELLLSFVSSPAHQEPGQHHLQDLLL